MKENLKLAVGNEVREPTKKVAVYAKETKFFNKKGMVYHVEGLTKVDLQYVTGYLAIHVVAQDMDCKSKR